MSSIRGQKKSTYKPGGLNLQSISDTEDTKHGTGTGAIQFGMGFTKKGVHVSIYFQSGESGNDSADALAPRLTATATEGDLEER